MDVNRVNLPVANDGRFPYDPVGNAGTLYPRGQAISLLFASGLWLGGTVGGLPRVTAAEYASEFAPGAMPGGVPDDPDRPEYVVYKAARWTGNPSDTAHVVRSAAELAADPNLDPLAHHSWSEYMAGAAPFGAPWRTHRLANTATPSAGDSVDVPGPDVLGDQMLWCVYNDGLPGRHVGIGSTTPLGVEVRQTVFAYDRPGPLGNTVFVRWEVFHFGSDSYSDLRMGFWSDPDIGDPGNDLAGCDTTRSLGVAYNPLWSVDGAFGSAQPAVGFDLLAERGTPGSPQRPGLDAFVEYPNGADPGSAEQAWNLLRGLQLDGSPMLVPPGGPETPFEYAGEPLTGDGWLDPFASNNKTLLASGPWSFAAGDTLTLWMAIVVGQGATPAGSLVALRCAADDVRDVFDSGFAEPFAAPRSCPQPAASCPRSAGWWAEQCAAGTAFSPAEWTLIARWADSVSTAFSFAGPDEAAAYCAALGTTATARDSARREYLAVLSNVAAGLLGLVPTDGTPASLERTTGVLADPLQGTSVAGLLRDEPYSRGLADVRYENDVATHRAALAGVPNGLPLFNGGAGPAALGMGSTLDPAAEPDSFATVLLRFAATAGQQAYRYLRLETALGDAPAGGREYRYGGHRFVPLTAWDLRGGRQLELAFAERAVTADDGTLLGAFAQPSTFDSTWAPDPGADGGLERLWVLARPYTSAPRPEFATDGVPLSGAWPALFQLDARRRAAPDVVDDGDGFRFVVGYPPTGSAEALLGALEVAAAADTEAAGLRSRLAAGLRSVNLGYGIGPVCIRDAPFSATLIEATVTGSHFRLRWQLGEPAAQARLERRSPYGIWLDAGPATLEPGGTALAEYDAASAGAHAFRLAVATAAGLARSDSVWIDRPGTPALAVTGVWPNPSGGAARVSFTLPSGGAAKLEVFDLGGRRAYERDLGTLGAGLYHVELTPGRRLRPGVYFVVLRFGGERRTARFVAL